MRISVSLNPERSIPPREVDVIFSVYPATVRRLERDLPELPTFFDFPRHLWRQLRTPNAIERCFVEVRRRTRPMVCFVHVQSVDRILYAIFQQYSPQWKTRTLPLFTPVA